MILTVWYHTIFEETEIGGRRGEKKNPNNKSPHPQNTEAAVACTL